MEEHPKVNPPKKANCPHCGNLTLHACVHREDYLEPFDYTIEGDPIWDDRWWAILKCTTCSKLSLYKDEWDDSKNKWETIMVYPEPLRAPKEVPNGIRDSFDEAISVLQRSPELASVGIRKCLEGITQEQEAKGRTLAERIRSLSSSGSVPKTLIDMMEASRSFGNIGAHYSEGNHPLK